jgi:hypothetical protein
MDKKGRNSPQARLGKKLPPEESSHTGKRISKPRNEPLTQVERERRDGASQNKFEKQEYGRRLDDLAASIRELQSSVAFLRREQEKAAAPPVETPSSSLQQEVQETTTTTKIESSQKEVEVPIEPGQLEGLRDEQKALTTRIEKLNKELDETQKKIDSLHGYYISQNQALDREFHARQLAIHQRAEDERTKTETDIAFLMKQRSALRDEIRALIDEKEALQKEVALGRSLSIILKNPQAISTVDINLLVEKFTEARDARVRGMKALSDLNTKEARRSLISSIMKIGRKTGKS